MANYCCATRTNYFHIKGREDEFVEFMDHICGDDGVVKLWIRQKDGEKLYGFGCYGSLIGYVADQESFMDGIDDYEEAWEKFRKGIQEFLAPDDAVIIMESGNENLRYVTGYATIITPEDVETVDLIATAVDRARELLGYSWNTDCEY